MDLRRLPRRHRGLTVLVAAAVPLAAAAVLSLFRGTLTAATDVLVLVSLVVVFGATGIRAAGLAAALSAAAWFDFFLTQPYGSFTIDDPNDLEAALILLLIGGVVTETALWGQRQEAALSREVGYVNGVLATAQSVSESRESPHDVVQAVAQRIRDLLDLDTCTFAPGGRAGDLEPILQHDGSLTRGSRVVDVEREGFPSDEAVVLPVRVAGELRGRFLLTASSHVARPSAQQRQVAVLLADQVASILPGPEGSATT
jgi:K+-sensing histidine kinase KdpD